MGADHADPVRPNSQPEVKLSIPAREELAALSFESSDHVFRALLAWNISEAQLRHAPPHLVCFVDRTDINLIYQSDSGIRLTSKGIALLSNLGAGHPITKSSEDCAKETEAFPDGLQVPRYLIP